MGSVGEAPRVGVGVFVLNSQNNFVFGKRKGSLGSGTWALPGGHLEHGESFEECARREVLEEIGMQVEGLQFLTAVNSILSEEGRHYVTIFMVCRALPGSEDPQLLEPNKCEQWTWMQWEEMEKMYTLMKRDSNIVQPQPDRLFLPMISLLEQRAGVRPLPP